MSGYPTCDEVIAWLRDRDQPYMADVVLALRESYRQCREANQKTLEAYYELKVKYEPPPACPPSHRSYLAKPESSD